MTIDPYRPSNPVPEESEDGPVEAAGSAKNAEDNYRHDLEAIQFVRQSIGLASRDPDLAVDGKANAVGVCRVVLELAADLYGNAGKDFLLESKLGRSEDVGQVVHRLVEVALETDVVSEPPSAFVGLYDLQFPPEFWTLKWNAE